MLITFHLKYEMIKCVITSSVSFSIWLNTHIDSIETSYEWWLATYRMHSGLVIDISLFLLQITQSSPNAKILACQILRGILPFRLERKLIFEVKVISWMLDVKLEKWRSYHEHIFKHHTIWVWASLFVWVRPHLNEEDDETSVDAERAERLMEF